MRPIFTAALAVFALAIAAPAGAQIYKWKDAKGVTHYSESPPAKGTYTTHAAPTPSAPATQPTATAEANKSADPRCNTARGNLAMLQGKSPVQRDSDSDGKPDKTLTDAERASELELARATLKAYNCSETVSASVTSGT